MYIMYIMYIVYRRYFLLGRLHTLPITNTLVTNRSGETIADWSVVNTPPRADLVVSKYHHFVENIVLHAFSRSSGIRKLLVNICCSTHLQSA